MKKRIIAKVTRKPEDKTHQFLSPLAVLCSQISELSDLAFLRFLEFTIKVWTIETAYSFCDAVDKIATVINVAAEHLPQLEDDKRADLAFYGMFRSIFYGEMSKDEHQRVVDLLERMIKLTDDDEDSFFIAITSAINMWCLNHYLRYEHVIQYLTFEGAKIDAFPSFNDMLEAADGK